MGAIHSRKTDHMIKKVVAFGGRGTVKGFVEEGPCLLGFDRCII